MSKARIELFARNNRNLSPSQGIGNIDILRHAERGFVQDASLPTTPLGVDLGCARPMVY